jgi:Rrf2 family iron-sulfur cluster assembly transcriptional regulator
LTILLGDDTRRESVGCASRGAVSTPKRPPKGKKNAVARKELAVKLSTKGRYAVMAMADLASREGMAGPVSLSEIAENQEISLSYLEQLFAKLRKGGLVVSVRGPGGGYRLSRPASELRVADIIVAVDEPISATRCKAGSPKGCTGTAARCLTHDLWEELGRQIHVFLSSVSLADVVERRVLGSARLRNTSEVRAAA